MATTQPPPYLFTRNPPRRGNSGIVLEDRMSNLNKLTQKLSLKSKSPSPMKTSSLGPEDNDHPQRNSMPATRRPANPPTSRNPFRDMNEAPPPPYSPNPVPMPDGPQMPEPLIPVSASSSTAPASAAQQPRDDDPYAFLCSFDTIFLIDDSGSMAGGRWRETKQALERITPVCTAHDADGIDIYFLNRADSREYHNITTKAKVESVFNSVRPGGGTPTGQRLNQILKPYLRRYEADPERTKPINIICITDGEPSDDVESPLIAAAKKLDKFDAPAWQVGVQFFQVGRDEEAKKHLKQLDDELAEIAGDDDLRDIVDTVPFTGAEGTTITGDGIMKVVLGSVNRRLDRKKSKDLHR